MRFRNPGVPSQAWNASDYARLGGLMTLMGQDVLSALNPQPGERILDLGCGDGDLTRQIAAAGALVLGVDGSEKMVSAARRHGLNVVAGRAEALPVDGPFDAVFSNAVLHWVRQQSDVAGQVWRVLKAGGRFVGEMGGHGNVASIRTAIAAVLAGHGIDALANLPWVFQTPEEYTQILHSAGFAVDEVRLIPKLVPLEAGMEVWLQNFANPLFAGVAESDKSSLTREILGLLSRSLRDRHGNWHVDYVRLRFRATKPSSSK